MAQPNNALINNASIKNDSLNKSTGIAKERSVSIKSVPFILMHLVCFTAIITGVSYKAIALCAAMYLIRMFALTAGYHRYFSHRSYSTSRAFQFLLAVLGCTAAQKGPLWWAAHHRQHHRYTDSEGDVHSPRQNGFWWAHIGWVLSTRYEPTNFEDIKDFARYPELRWLNNWHIVPAFVLAVGCYFFGGWQGLVWGFFISTVVLYHGTFSINSLSHMFGSQRYETGDDSRNNLFLALLTSGEGWHNNHHHYMASVRQGFFWWEIDLSFYGLKVLESMRLVWNLRLPPARLLAG
jgi:stearoyl-CoA desaturase (delta-9 desaturase)